MDRVSETRTAEIFVGDGFVLARTRAGVVQSIGDAEENLQKTIEARDGRRCPLLIDISNCEPLTRDVRHCYSGEKLEKAFSAVGVLVTASAFGRTMGNIYLSIARPSVPARLFTSTEEAIRWTSTFSS